MTQPKVPPNTQVPRWSPPRSSHPPSPPSPAVGGTRLNFNTLLESPAVETPEPERVRSTTPSTTVATYDGSSCEIASSAPQVPATNLFASPPDAPATVAKTGKKARPMPDISAFNTTSRKSNSSSKPPPSPLLCPPTPQRTPGWAKDSLTPALQRQDSLHATKVLAAAPDDMEVESPDNQHEGQGSKPFSLTVSIPPPTPQPFPQTQNSPTSQSLTSAPTITFATSFSILGLLGAGAFADVHKVKSLTSPNFYAVKRCRRQFRGKKDRDRALREVAVLQKLAASPEPSARYVIGFVRAWQEDGYFFSQTELCCTGNLGRLIETVNAPHAQWRSRYPTVSSTSGPDEDVTLTRALPGNSLPPAATGRLIPEPAIWNVIHDVASGLLHIHEAGYLHLDIKPSNVFFALSTPTHCKIGDFGMACKVGGEEDGQEGDTMYMARELLEEGAKMKSADMFSLGLTVLEMAAGPQFEVPAEGDAWHELRSGAGVQLPKSRSKDLRVIIDSLINPDADARPTAAQVIADCERNLGNSSFLSGFVTDVQALVLAKERQLSATYRSARNRRFTPTAAVIQAAGAPGNLWDDGDRAHTPTPREHATTFSWTD